MNIVPMLNHTPSSETNEEAEVYLHAF